MLISAYACRPDEGSEPGVGWNWAVQASRYHEVWVLTRMDNRPSIERHLLSNRYPNLRVVYFNAQNSATTLLPSFVRTHLKYFIWQLLAVKEYRRLHQEWNFDVVHHLTYCTFRYPSFLSRLQVPFVWGPLGGGEEAPLRFWRSFGFSGLVQESIRTLSNMMSKINPLVRMTSRSASVVLLATEESRSALPPDCRQRAWVEPAIGMEATGPVPDRAASAGGSIELLFVGRLLYWKGVQFALASVSDLICKGYSVHLSVIGDGPYYQELVRLSQKLKIEREVTFLGELPRDEVLLKYGVADIFVFPSLHDSGGLAVLEALSFELPVVCLAIGGPALSVSSETGIRVAAIYPDQVVEALSDAIAELIEKPEKRSELGRMGKKRINSEYSWTQKGEMLRELYPFAVSQFRETSGST